MERMQPDRMHTEAKPVAAHRDRLVVLCHLAVLVRVTYRSAYSRSFGSASEAEDLPAFGPLRSRKVSIPQ